MQDAYPGVLDGHKVTKATRRKAAVHYAAQSRENLKNLMP